MHDKTIILYILDNFATQLARLHYHLHSYGLDSHHLSSLRLVDECISEIGDYTESEAHIDPKDEKSVMSTCINALYTLIQSSHKTRYINNVHKLSCLFYQIVSKHNNYCGKHYFVNIS